MKAIKIRPESKDTRKSLGNMIFNFHLIGVTLWEKDFFPFLSIFHEVLHRGHCPVSFWDVLENLNLTPVYSEGCFSKNAYFINFNKNEHHGRRFSGKCPICPEKLIGCLTLIRLSFLKVVFSRRRGGSIFQEELILLCNKEMSKNPKNRCK